MTWSEVTVPATHRGQLAVAFLRFTVGDVCLVEVDLGGELGARASGSDLFEALVAARRLLEDQGVLLACNGCRRDVFPSPMLRQAAHGRRAYVLILPRTDASPPPIHRLS
jgi:hypothetical protein